MKSLLWIGSLLVLIGSIGMFFTQESLRAETAGTLSYSEVISQNIDEIEMNAELNDISVIKSPDNLIHINVTKAKSKDVVQHYINDKKLIVDTITKKQKKAGFFRFNFNTQNEAHIEVALPHKQFKTIHINTNIGSLNVENLKSDEVDVTTEIGSVDIDKINSNHVRFKVGTGEIEVNRLATNKLDFDIDMGSLSIKGLEKDTNVKGDIGTGEAYIEYKEVPDNARVNLQADTGEIETNGLFKNQDTLGIGKTKINVTVDLGSLEIDKE